MERRTWCGLPPKTCDICGVSLKATFIDGATRQGPWANMCSECHKTHGKGFGIGLGQKYELDDESKEFVKTKG